ncbi:MAG TPA: molybdopterin cofactor-binding domain-containing protein [Bryobacteraceae bacterium]
MNTSSGIPEQIEKVLATHRRGFIRNAGLFAVSIGVFTASGTDALAQNSAAANATGAGPYPVPDYHQIDSWIVIHEDNTATFYVGKTDPGQGTGTAFRQLMSDELDIAFDKTACIMGSTDITVDQVGAGGSSAIERDSIPMRRVAAEARRVLLGMASTALAAPVDALTVKDGVITLKADPSKRITYGELIGGKKFNVALTGGNINAITGAAKIKQIPDLKYAGQSIQRDDIPAKVDGSLKWAVDVKLPNMVHARNVKPPFACAKLTGIDESSVKNLPGFIQVMNKGNYVAVVCEREEQAINAARALKTTWDKPATAPFPTSQDLFDYLRTAPVAGPGRPNTTGDPDAAFAGAAHTIEAEYQIPFQGHTAFAGAHALADPSNGLMTIYSNDMKTYGMRRGIATFLGMPADKVRVVYMQGPQGFGRTAAEDAASEAAWIAQQLGRPVRMQWMRDEETAWDSKSPAFLVKMRGALDASGNLVGYEYNAKACDLNHLGYNDPQTTLIAQLMGTRTPKPAGGSASLPSDSYAIPNRRQTADVVGLPEIWETPLRTGNLRDPNGPQAAFASESFIDEAAVAAKADALEFRLKLLATGPADDPGFRRVRSIAVLKAAAQTYGWTPRPSPRPLDKGNILTGRGIAYTFRGNSMVAQIAEVEVSRQTGHVFAKRLVCAYDVGFVVNPEALRRTAECATLHGLSRALHEEVRFDTEKVTSRDWFSHPTLRHLDIPEKLEVVLVNGDPNPNRPDLPSYGAGEAAMKPMLAAIGNAIHDATGVRIRRVPFRDDSVLAALKAAKL